MLLEKQVTVPATYPMTLAAVRTGCNQSSSREPVVDYDEPTRRGDAAPAQGPPAGAGGVGRQRPAHAEVPPAALRGARAGRRRAGPGHRAAAARRPGAGRAEDPHRAAARLRRPRGGRGVAWPTWPPGPSRWSASCPRQRGQHDARWVHLLGDVPVADGTAPSRAGGRPRLGARRRRRGSRRSGCARPTTRSRRRTPTTWPTSCRPAAVRALAARPGRRARRRRPRGRGRLRPGPRHRLPRRRRAPTRSASTSRRAMVAEARRRFPDGDYQVGDLRRLMRPTSGAGLVGGARVVLADPPRRRPSSPTRWPRSPGRCCRAAGWSSPCTPAPRSATSTTGSTPRSTSTSSCTTRPRSSAWWRPPVWSTSSGTTAARSPPATRPPSGSTSSAASRPDHAGAVLLDIGVRPRLPDAPAGRRLPRRPAHDVLWATSAQATAMVAGGRHRGSRVGGERGRGGGAPACGPVARRGGRAGRAGGVRVPADVRSGPGPADGRRPARHRPRLGAGPARARERGAGRAAGGRGARGAQPDARLRWCRAGRRSWSRPATGWPACGGRTASTCRPTPAASGRATSTSARPRCRPCRWTTSRRPAAAARRRRTACRPSDATASRSSTSRWARSSSVPELLRDVVAGVAALPVRVLVAVGPRMDAAALGRSPGTSGGGSGSTSPRCWTGARPSSRTAARAPSWVRWPAACPSSACRRLPTSSATQRAAIRAGASLALRPVEVTPGSVRAAVERLLARPRAPRRRPAGGRRDRGDARARGGGHFLAARWG